MSTAHPVTDHTKGATFSRATLATLPAGTWSAESSVFNKSGALVQALEVNFQALAEPDAQGNTHALSVLASAGQTQDWPIGPLMWVTRYTDASADPVVVPAVSRVIQCSQYTVPQRPGDDPLAVIPDAMAPVLRGEKGEDAGGATNLSYTASPSGGLVTSDTGTDATIPLADGTNAGLMTPAEKARIAATSGTNTGDQDLSGYATTSHNHSGVYDPAGTAASAVSNHTGATDPHGDRAFASAADAAILAAANAHAESLVVGLVDDRGNYNASGNTYPASGGSGTAGAVLKGDLWTVSVAGTLGGKAVTAGDLVRALVDAPGQTAGNWAVTENNIGYVPENAADKDASGGFAGLTGFALNLKNALGTVTSWFTTEATAARTWTMPDKSGTVAMTSDIPASTDGLTEGSTNLYSTAARIRSTVLTGLSTAAGTVVTATHTVLEAIGFLQKQVSDNTSAISGKQATLVSGANIKTVNSTSLLGSGDLTVSASPGGSTTQVQYNSAGAFAGDAGMVYDVATGKLTATKLRSSSAGSAPAPSVAIGSGGLYSRDAYTTNICNGGGGEVAEFGSSGLGVKGGLVIGWGASAAKQDALDVAFSRLGAASVALGSGANGSYAGGLKLRNLIASGGVVTLASFTVATLPSASTSGAGAQAFVTDANATTPRSTVASGGSNKVNVFSDGTNWLIAA